MRNVMQEAFARINNPPPFIKGSLLKVFREDIRHKPGKDWSTKLSFKTYNQLKTQGVMA